MNIFLFANDSTKSDIEKVNKVCKTDDIFVLFNHASPLQYESILKQEHKILCLNQNAWGFHGHSKAFKFCDIYDKIYLHIVPPLKESHISQIKSLKNKISNNFSTFIYKEICEHYNKLKHPTIGFLGYFLIKKLYPDSIIYLVHFTGVKEKYHNSEYEQEFFNSKPSILRI